MGSYVKFYNCTVNVEFKIPNTYVATSPLIVNAHILLEKKGFVSGNIQLRLRADYRGNAEEWGQGTANTNYKQTVTSPVTAVAEPTGADKQNSARHYRLQFTLPQGVAAPEDWAFFSIDRVSLASGNYTGPIYLSVISVRYATS